MNKFNEGYMPPLALQKLVKYFVLFKKKQNKREMIFHYNVF